MRTVLLFTFFTFFLSSIHAQGGGDRQSNGRLYGKVIDAKTKSGLDAVSVQIKIVLGGEEGGEPRDSTIAGMFTRKNGDFSFDNMPLNRPVAVVITAVGYAKKTQEVDLKTAGDDGSNQIDLGNFAMDIEARVLQNVTVTSTRPTMELGIDRRVFNVEKNITSAGGTAVDVMKNIPSVTIDVEGNVQLRNASPQIFIDGRPTILTLDQIPADNIANIELITNPSAKFDASSNAGIINIVLKKNKRVGLNGTASVSGGTPDIRAASLNLNMREGKINFFAGGDLNQSGGRADGKTFRQNKRNGIIDNYFNQLTFNNRLRNFKSVRFGFDYYMDNRNTLTLTQNFVTGEFTNNEDQNQEYLNSSKQLERTGTRTSIGNSEFNRSSSRILYTHKFARSGHELSADANYNKGSGDNLTNIVNSYFSTNGSTSSETERVRNNGNNNNDQFTLQVDYALPLSENSKIEAGARSFVQNNRNIFDAFSTNQFGGQTKLSLSNDYKYKETVNALYFSFANKINKFSYQAGLRAEASKFDGESVDKGERFSYSYPSELKNIWDGLFPSFFITQSLGEKEDLQLNYTRRIRRPNFRQLNPSIDFNDPVNLRQGNPTLRPEFTNAFEINYNKNYESGNFLAAIYYRNTIGDITEYSDTLTAVQFAQLNNAAVDSNAILNTYINSTSQNIWGGDITLQQTIAKNLEIVPNINVQYRKVNAAVNNTNLSNQGFSWEAKLITNYKLEAAKSWLFKNLSFQLTGEYESPEVIPQGRRKEQYSVDFALRKDLFKMKSGTLTFSVNDVFNTRRFGTIYDTENFYQDSYRRWNVRSFRLTFSYKFGSSNFSLFKRTGREERDNERDNRTIDDSSQ